MHKMIKIATLCAAIVLGGCAGPAFMRGAPAIGDPVAAVTARLGQPTNVYPLPDGSQELEYATGPMGQYTWMAVIGPDGRLASYEQVLTGKKFATIKIDRATKDDVLRTVGRPAERSHVAMHDYEVWSYRYKENGVWNSMMHVHFDTKGKVRLMQNGPDPMYEIREHYSD